MIALVIAIVLLVGLVAPFCVRLGQVVETPYTDTINQYRIAAAIPARGFGPRKPASLPAR